MSAADGQPDAGIVLADAPQVRARAPDPGPPEPLHPVLEVRLRVTRCSWTLQDGAVLAEVQAAAQTWAAGSAGTLTLSVQDASLDHLRVGDTLVLSADPGASP